MMSKQKKVLITGADGFIGSHLVEALLGEGANVKAFCYYNSFNNLGWLDTFEQSKLSEIEIVTGDVRDPYGVKRAMEDVSSVYHLAALIGIPYSYNSPDSYVDTNIKGTLNVLQAARELNCENIIITSTSETYGTAQYVPINESHPLNAQSPYAATKVAADQMALSFFRSFDLPVKIVRPFNTYGPRQSARAVIPTVITQILDGQKRIQLGVLEPTRDFTFVKDTVSGFLAVSESELCLGQVVNIGANKEIAIGALAHLIAEIMDEDIEIVQEQQRMRPKKSEVERLFCDNSKICELTGWSPQTDLRLGIGKTIEWLKEHKNSYKSELYNV